MARPFDLENRRFGSSGEAAVRPEESKPGEHMRDGTIYAGISPDTGQPMYTTPEDVPLTVSWKDANHIAALLVAHSRQDWRVPTRAELNVLFNNRAAIGGLNEAPESAGWY